MVSASELIALRQLLSMTQRGITIEERPAAADTADAEQMPEIVIEPITIAPIVLAKIEGAAE
jgi:hypothetical protein